MQILMEEHSNNAEYFSDGYHHDSKHQTYYIYRILFSINMKFYGLIFEDFIMNQTIFHRILGLEFRFHVCIVMIVFVRKIMEYSLNFIVKFVRNN